MLTWVKEKWASGNITNLNSLYQLILIMIAVPINLHQGNIFITLSVFWCLMKLGISYYWRISLCQYCDLSFPIPPCLFSPIGSEMIFPIVLRNDNVQYLCASKLLTWGLCILNSFDSWWCWIHSLFLDTGNTSHVIPIYLCTNTFSVQHLSIFIVFLVLSNFICDSFK